jgi:hypothetical protein
MARSFKAFKALRGWWAPLVLAALVALASVAVVLASRRAFKRRAAKKNKNKKECDVAEAVAQYPGTRKATITCFNDKEMASESKDFENAVAVNERDWGCLKNKQLKITWNGRTETVKVLDYCRDGDCAGCCSRNSKDTGFLIDIHDKALRSHFKGLSKGCDNTKAEVEFEVVPDEEKM